MLRPRHHIIFPLERLRSRRPPEYQRRGRRRDADERHRLKVGAVGVARLEPGPLELIGEIVDRQAPRRSSPARAPRIRRTTASSCAPAAERDRSPAADRSARAATPKAPGCGGAFGPMQADAREARPSASAADEARRRRWLRCVTVARCASGGERQRRSSSWFSVISRPPIRSSVASARIFVALTISSIAAVLVGLVREFELARPVRDAVRHAARSARRACDRRYRGSRSARRGVRARSAIDRSSAAITGESSGVRVGCTTIEIAEVEADAVGRRRRPDRRASSSRASSRRTLPRSEIAGRTPRGRGRRRTGVWMPSTGCPPSMPLTLIVARRGTGGTTGTAVVATRATAAGRRAPTAAAGSCRRSR